MKLNEHHRSALIEKLKSNQEKQNSSAFFRNSIEKDIIDGKISKEDDQWLLYWRDVDQWLLEKELEWIEKAIKDNELDNW